MICTRNQLKRNGSKVIAGSDSLINVQPSYNLQVMNTSKGETA
jgi:hypothetical protein